MAKILIIDDSIFTRRVIGKTLTDANHTSTEATCGAEGIEAMQADSYDCITLDLLMPNMSGFEVLAKMKELGLTTPVIVLTADIQEESKNQCLELGAKEIVNKPPKADVLLAAINNAISQPV